MTPAREKLVRDAQAAGYKVTNDNGTLDIVKTRRFGDKVKVVAGLRLYPDGTAYDITVELSAAKGLRSYRDMRAVLGLNEGG